MRIDDLTTPNGYISEKQIQPAQGKTEGNILIMGGGPGSGKNWALRNLTDVPNRYKVFDVDSLLEVSAKMDSPKFKKSFGKYIQSNFDEQISTELLGLLDSDGVFGFLKSPDRFVNEALRSYISDSGLYKNLLYNFFNSILDGVKPNIAFNTTLRNMNTVEKNLTLLKNIGYDVDSNVDFLFVLTTEDEAIDNANKRAVNLRQVDQGFLLDARDNFNKNAISIATNSSPLSSYVRNLYVVFNSKHNTEYYDGGKVIKDFKYMKLTLNDTDKVERLKKMITGVYA